MFAEKAKVLLILSQDVLERARVCAGKATATTRLPVSLQIVLRALIEEGLKRGDDPSLLANMERQARAVRRIRRLARRGERAEAGRDGDRPSGDRPSPSRRERPRAPR